MFRRPDAISSYRQGVRKITFSNVGPTMIFATMSSAVMFGAIMLGK